MPELPEVETIVRDLSGMITGRMIVGVRVLKPDLIGGGGPVSFARALEGSRIHEITRRAKNLVFDLGDGRLVVNLGMTGRLLVSAPDSPPPPHLGVCFDLDDGRHLLYQDVRRFGRLEHLSADEWATRDATLGLEPLSASLDDAELYRLTRWSRVAIKTWLMDQRRVVGVGNIYASEALYRARIDPRRAARRITKKQAATLRTAVQEVLREAIDFRGTTLLDYRDAAGERGEFATRLQVYDRAGEPCRTCGEPILRIVQGGRSTFFCPHCQK
jgi:formamidopyrimidine-DNA glycosylase